MTVTPQDPPHQAVPCQDKHVEDIPAIHKLVFPQLTSFLLEDKNKHCKTGDEIMKGIFSFASSYGGYPKAFGHGKKTEFLTTAFNYIFTIQGPCNFIKQPSSYTNFRDKTNVALKVLEKHYNAKHSSSNAEHGEGVPEHLFECYNIYRKLRESAESDTDKSTSQKNKEMQSSITGQMAPLGTNTNIEPRDSTRAVNAKRTDIDLVPRNKDVLHKHAIISVDDDDELRTTTTTPTSSTKSMKRGPGSNSQNRNSKDKNDSLKKSKKRHDVADVIDENGKSQQGLTKAILDMQNSSSDAMILKMNMMKGRNE